MFGRKKRKLIELSDNPSKSLESCSEDIRKTFGAANCVYGGAVGSSGKRPFEWCLLESLAKRADAKNFFLRFLDDENPCLAAYCVLGLKIMNVDLKETIPNDLIARDELIEFKAGCFFERLSLGGFAKRLIHQQQSSEA